MSARRFSQTGFSLIELSMVLVIIGLLVSGLLKGNELIQQARIRNIASSFDNLVVAIQTYQDRYRSLPGDDVQAAGRWPSSAVSGNGDRIICGGYEGGSGGSSCSGSASESVEVWQHLRSAGLLTGTGNQPPENADTGIYGVQYGAFGISKHVLCANNLKGSVAGSLDRQLDDGLANQGNIRGATSLASTSPTTSAYVEEGTAAYVVCRAL